MDLGLRDKTVLVTASSKGLGRACALALSQEGARVAICARESQALECAATEIRQATGNEVLSMPADLSRDEDCRRVVEDTVAHFGALHVLVTNNGGPPPGDFLAFSDDDWYRAVDLTLMSAVRLVRAALPIMQQQQWGRIVNIVSITAREPLDNLVLSNALRPGVIGMARTLANQVAAVGITVNNVLPGMMRTDRVEQLAEAQANKQGIAVEEVLRGYAAPVPVGRVGRPEELAALVAFLASEQAAYINGVSILVDGGRFRGLM